MLALHQPAASDLRMIMASLKITTDLERIGDQAVNICTRLNTASRGAFGVDSDIERMSATARAMVKSSLEALQQWRLRVGENRHRNRRRDRRACIIAC